MKKVLMVIDMQNDFLIPGSPLDGGDPVRAILPFVKKKIDAYLAKGDRVIFTRDWHHKDDAEFETFPPHCIANTKGAEIVYELQYAFKNPRTHVVNKTRYSAFYGTSLEQVLKAFEADAEGGLSFDVVGICTNICVIFTVEELRNRDYPVTVYKAGTASFDEKAHEYALNQMESILGVQII